MQSVTLFPIEPLAPDDFEAEFVPYLDDHLSDNGVDGAVPFQPLSRATSTFAPERRTAFRAALERPVGAPGWRRAWVARDAQGRVAGHIDLRAHPELFSVHRCLLGMGVDRNQRRRGLGAALIAHAVDWTRRETAIDWIDLQVISGNEAARRLYASQGFVVTGEQVDRFRIDGRSLGFTSMALRLER